jgi:hypothetical protein
MPRTFADHAEDAFRQAERWASHNRGLIRAAGVLLLAYFAFWLLSVATGLFIVLALVAAALLFARAWLREFAFLMHVGDDAFPGRNDKLIWAVLLIVLPPVGLYLFRAHRRAYWPESDAKAAMVADELA